MFSELLPALLGNETPSLAGSRYDPLLHPGRSAEFTSVAFRVADSLVGCEAPAPMAAVQGPQGTPLAQTYFRAAAFDNPGALLGRPLGLAHAGCPQTSCATRSRA